MDKRLAMRLLSGVLTLLTPMMSAIAQEPQEAVAGVVVSSGIAGGGYWSAASRLKNVADELGLQTRVQPSTGSLHNLEQLTDPNSPVNLAFAQADALRYYLNDHPGVEAQIETLENIGQECVFVITGKNSAIRTDADLQNSANHRLGIASADSGVAVTFRYMASQLAGLKNTRVVYGDTAVALQGLNSEQASVDAVMVVHRPREHSAEVDMVLQQPDRYRFVEIVAQRLTDAGGRDEAVYQSLNLAMPAAADGERQRVRTICVKGLLLANREKLNLEQRDQLSQLVNQYWMRVYATE